MVVPVHSSRSDTYIENSTFGSWIEIALGDVIVKGELISFDSDSVCVMELNGIKSVNQRKIKNYEIHPVQNRARKTMGFTMVALTPSLLGAMMHGEPGFLVISAATLLTGGLAAGIEKSRQSTIIKGYGRLKKEYIMYCRFPGGIPEFIPKQDLVIPVERLQNK